MTGTFINIGTVLAGTLLGTLVGGRLPEGLQQRVMAGLGLVTLVIGVDSALAWNETNPLYVLGGVGEDACQVLAHVIASLIDLLLRAYRR